MEIKAGEVYVNKIQLNEWYISAKTSVWEGGFLKEAVPVTVPANELWVMGDNRPRSSDSREFGPIKIDSLIGLVFYRYFPPGAMGALTNPLPSALRGVSAPSLFFAVARQ